MSRIPAQLPFAEPAELGLSAERLDEVFRILEAHVADGRFPGEVLAIARHGRCTCLHPFGFRDPVSQVPMTADTLFWAASMTKPMTVVGALKLHERSQLMLGDAVSVHLPEFEGQRVAVLGKDVYEAGQIETVAASRPPTLHDLMTHTGGVIEGMLGDSASVAAHSTAQ